METNTYTPPISWEDACDNDDLNIPEENIITKIDKDLNNVNLNSQYDNILEKNKHADLFDKVLDHHEEYEQVKKINVQNLPKSNLSNLPEIKPFVKETQVPKKKKKNNKNKPLNNDDEPELEYDDYLKYEEKYLD
jgi:hypothetical protein